MALMANSSFAIPIRLMAPQQRQAIVALYRWCRAMDDIADHPHTQLVQKKSALDEWEQELRNLYEGHPTHPLFVALLPYIENLNPLWLHEILNGVRMDLDEGMLRPTLAQLDHYCYRVAGCVGLCVMQLLGDQSAGAQHFAIQLGHALQRTNILRDVMSDAAMGRIYLPREWLEEFGLAQVAPHEIASHTASLKPVITKLSDAALGYYAAAQQAGIDCQMKPIAALLMRDMYLRLHQKMQRDEWHYHHPYRHHLLDKIWLLGRYARYRLR